MELSGRSGSVIDPAGPAAVPPSPLFTNREDADLCSEWVLQAANESRPHPSPSWSSVATWRLRSATMRSLPIGRGKPGPAFAPTY